MELNFKQLGSGEPLIILHGLFGSLDNWMSFAKKMSEHYEVFIVDQRNHGKSPHSNEFNYTAMADDLFEFIKTHQIIDPIILGHSMGGKTAMQFAMNYPTEIDQLIVADIAPKAYPVHHHQIIEGLKSLDFSSIQSRGQADLELSKYIDEISTRQFLLKNLFWEEKGKLNWRFNLSVISDRIEIIGHGLENASTFTKNTLFIRGDKSNYITEKDYKAIQEIFLNSSIETIENSGHWVHAENPEKFEEIVTSFLLS